MKGLNSQGAAVACLILASSVVSYVATLAILASRSPAPLNTPPEQSQTARLSLLDSSEGFLLEVAGSRARCRRRSRQTTGSVRTTSGRCNPCNWGSRRRQRVNWINCCPCYDYWSNSSWSNDYWDDDYWSNSSWNDDYWDDDYWGNSSWNDGYWGDNSWNGRYRRRGGYWSDRSSSNSYSSNDYGRRNYSSGTGSYRGTDYYSNQRYPGNTDAIPGAW